METLQDIWADLTDRLRAFVGKRVSDPHAADDITQDVLLKVQSHLETLPPEEKLAAWIFSIARNAIIDHYRATAIRQQPDLTNIDVADETTEREAIKDLTPCLKRMVELLPQPYREAIKLADFEDVSQREIADRAGISLSGAKSRVQRARHQLREMILDCCHVERDGRGNIMDYERTQRSSRYCDDDKNSPCDP